ncbi:hypothetical protein FN846DRAFT_988462 [Sphaerosporella brunnea]|uniref:Uncharacterized protein n=1 Tax=Sphaerosporella brunnea TaxID=1250544 RepID=A0A5J5F818_9PEZI|nr:hypothetical protein FN846DRAFT_988462 [Sphaerosporella brunnea]
MPIYLGKQDEAFEPKKMTALLVQVKNSVEEEYYKDLFDLENPLIIVLADLGVKKPSVSVPRKSLRISVSEAGTSTYNCVSSERTATALGKILSLSASSARDAQHRVSDCNMRFSSHDWKGGFLQSYLGEDDGPVANRKKAVPKKKTVRASSEICKRSGKLKRKAEDIADSGKDQEDVGQEPPVRGEKGKAKVQKEHPSTQDTNPQRRKFASN